VPLGSHWFDLIIVFAIALLFFGAKRLPEMGSAVGKTIREFQKSMRDIGAPSDTTASASRAVAGSADTPQIAGPSAVAKSEPAQPTAEPIQQ
jgi:sec-independent protein translocase protein TatA